MIGRLLVCAVAMHFLMTIDALHAGEPKQLSGPPLPEASGAPAPMLPDGLFTLAESQRQSKPPTPATLAALAQWIAAAVGLPTPAVMPTVEIVAPARIGALRHHGFDPQTSAPADDDTVAIYVHTSRTIYLPEGWHAASPADLSVLVHELVHHMQSEARLPFACAEEREKLAYAAQARWLEGFGRTLEGEFRIDPFTLLVRTNCLG
jgi:hypothetical protein